jgi:hypothetical protein
LKTHNLKSTQKSKRRENENHPNPKEIWEELLLLIYSID